jgi:CheY-like chemotaxis protein
MVFGWISGRSRQSGRLALHSPLQMRILVLEDYPPLGKVIEIGLRRIGHEAVRVDSVKAALAIEGEFELATMDVDLPDGRGTDVAARMIADGRLKRVVFFSATSDPELEERARSIGPFVEKAYGVEALVQVIQQLVPDGDAVALAQAVGAPGVGVRAAGRSGTRRRVR